MTFTFKLARRMATIRAALLVAPVAGALACGGGEPLGVSADGPMSAGSSSIDASAGNGLVAAAQVTSIARPTAITPALPRTFLNTTVVAPTGATITVRAGGSLPAALAAARCGDQILLDAGAVFSGNFALPTKSCTGWITIRTNTTLPAPGQRMTPALATRLAKLVSPNTSPALRADMSSHHYRIIGVELSVATSVTLNYGIVQFGMATETVVSQLPHDIVLDRAYVHGHSRLQASRCIALNSASTAVIDSWISECHAKRSEAQGIGGWGGTGPFKIVNNYIEASAQNIMFGGADSRIAGLVPSDIEIRHNHLIKPMSWQPTLAWTVKNLIELKNARRVLVEGNLLENCWTDGQTGFAVVMFSVNQSGHAPWSTVQDVTFRSNILRNVASGFNLSIGETDATPAARFLITNNLLDRIGAVSLGGAGQTFQVLHGPSDVSIEHNTVVFAPVAVKRSALFMDYGLGQRLVLRNNVLEKGVMTSGYVGASALNRRYSEWYVEKNVFAGISSASYPVSNYFPPTITAVAFQSFASGVYSLSSASAYNNVGTDGTDIGVDWAALLKQQDGVP